MAGALQTRTEQCRRSIRGDTLRPIRIGRQPREGSYAVASIQGVALARSLEEMRSPVKQSPAANAFAILMFLFLAIPVVAQNENAAKDLSDSGRVFFSTCAVVDKPVSTLTVSEAIPYVHCVSYVGAIFDTMALYDSIGIGPHVFCAPEQDRVQRDALVRSVRKYIAAHPELSNEQTVYLVRLALLDEFSCRSAKR